jgi:hypothetical protein
MTTQTAGALVLDGVEKAEHLVLVELAEAGAADDDGVRGHGAIGSVGDEGDGAVGGSGADLTLLAGLVVCRCLPGLVALRGRFVLGRVGIEGRGGWHRVLESDETGAAKVAYFA